jgi:ATP-dependent Clp protease ATP-binding subunit ClpB
MALDANRWTQKTQEAFSAAVADARGRNNPEVTPDHLLLGLLGQDGTAVLPVLARVGVAALTLKNRLEEALSQLPHSYGGDSASLSRGARDLLEQAGRERDALGDEYLSVEHVLLASAKRVGVSREALLDALKDVRGSHRVTSQNPEETFQALENMAATSLWRLVGASSTLSSGATKRSGGSSRSCPGGPRTTPSS